MATAPTRRISERPIETVGDLLARLGGIPARRVRLAPTPGTANARDLLRVNESKNRTAICELVDGTLVEKPVGYEESALAMLLGTFLNTFILPRKLGVLLGEAGMLRLQPGLVRVPDLSFLRQKQVDSLTRPAPAIPSLAPDLAVEVLSRGNTKAEMKRKVGEYFAAGSRLVWLVDGRKKTVHVYTSPTEIKALSVGDTLDGGEVLLGFRLPLRDLFVER